MSLLKNFPQFAVIHTPKGIGIVNKAEVDVFLELYCFFHDPADVGNLWQKIKCKQEKSFLVNFRNNYGLVFPVFW